MSAFQPAAVPHPVVPPATDPAPPSARGGVVDGGLPTRRRAMRSRMTGAVIKAARVIVAGRPAKANAP
jgi:hypothetical protein